MKNIPTDLMRAFVAVVDLKGFTRAGERLGRSQPAISLQIKRLQDLLGVPLFDKDQGAVALTEHGQMVVNYARRILALNDELDTRLSGQVSRSRVRLGMPYDYAEFVLPRIIGRGSDGFAGAYDVTNDVSSYLLEQLRTGELDVVVAAAPDSYAEGALYSWHDPLVWVGSPAHFSHTAKPLPLLVCQEGCLYRRLMINTLSNEGRPYEIVYTNPAMSGMSAALNSGFGVTVLAKRVCPPDYPVLSTGDGLPQLPDLVVGIYVRSDDARPETQALAQRIAGLFGVGADKAAA